MAQVTAPTPRVAAESLRSTRGVSGSCRGRVGVVSGSVRGRVGVRADPRPMGGRPEADLRPICRRFMSGQKPIRGWSWVDRWAIRGGLLWGRSGGGGGRQARGTASHSVSRRQRHGSSLRSPRRGGAPSAAPARAPPPEPRALLPPPAPRALLPPPAPRARTRGWVAGRSSAHSGSLCTSRHGGATGSSARRAARRRCASAAG